MADIERLTQLIEPVVMDQGLALVRVKLTGGGGDPTLQIMAEDPATRQLTLDDCAQLSRRLSRCSTSWKPAGTIRWIMPIGLR
jgi:ribosome maturation factor RimP